MGIIQKMDFLILNWLQKHRGLKIFFDDGNKIVVHDDLFLMLDQETYSHFGDKTMVGVDCLCKDRRRSLL